MDDKYINIKYKVVGTFKQVDDKYQLSIKLSAKSKTDHGYDEVEIEVYNKIVSLTKSKISKSDLSGDNVNQFIDTMKKFMLEPKDLIEDINLLYKDIKTISKSISYQSAITIERDILCKNTYDAELDIELYVGYSDNKDVVINRIAGKVDGCTVIANVDKACRTSKRIEDICQYLEESQNIDINSDVYTKINLALEALQPKNEGNYIHLGGYDFLSAEIIYKIKMYVNKI